MELYSLPKRSKWVDFLLAVFIVLLRIPQTGDHIQVAINWVERDK